MRNNDDIHKLLRSIKNALWIIVAILLIQFGSDIADLRGGPFADILKLAAFWAGFFLFIHMLVRAIIGQFEKPDAKDDDNGA